MMKKIIWLIVFTFFFTLFTQPLLADDSKQKDYSNEPWERAALYLGGFFVNMNSDLDLGFGGQGTPKITVDAEDLLGLDEDFAKFRVDALWRITRRNRVDLTYYDVSRDGSNFIGIEIPDGEGGTIPIGSDVETDFDFTILRASYAYSFFKNETFEIGAAGGLYGMDVDFKIKDASGRKIEDTAFTVPLPVIGLRGTFALTPKWFIRQSFDYFYVDIGDYEGHLIDFLTTVEWNALKYLGLGIGYNYVGMSLKYSGSDDYLSKIDMSYGGLLAFAKFYF